jgi:hypothetical protein
MAEGFHTSHTSFLAFVIEFVGLELTMDVVGMDKGDGLGK